MKIGKPVKELPKLDVLKYRFPDIWNALMFNQNDHLDRLQTTVKTLSSEQSKWRDKQSKPRI